MLRNASSNIADLVLSSPTLRRRLDYPRFQRPQLSVLLLEGHYHLVGELKRALEANGHRVSCVPVASTADTMLRNVLVGLTQNQPDFVLSINYLGFDEEGALGSILETLEIPLAVWFVDSPLFILRGCPVPAPTVSYLFSWERTLVPLLKKNCPAQYLPLASDPKAFSGSSMSNAQGIAFVGDSGLRAQAKWSKRLKASDKKTVDKLANQVRQRSETHFYAEIFRTNQHAVDQLAAATWQANTNLRTQFVKAFDTITLYGDEGWETVAPNVDLQPGPTYGPQLSQLYRQTAINLNITSLQMPTAVNQRVFDVPVSGGFLITDAQNDVFELFGEDELVTWSTIEEATDKTQFYLRHPARRHALIERGQKRVLAQHTYQHRAADLVQVMQTQFGASLRPSAALRVQG